MKTPNENPAAKNPAGKRQGWMTKGYERMDYGLYLAGQNIIYSLVTSFLVTYLLMCGIEIGKITTVMFAVKIWDTINDALFGGLFDKVKFKKQVKFLPWLRISVVLIPLATILMYAIPQKQSETVKLAWFAAAYVLWDSAYTLCDAPIYGIITTMTSNLAERTSIMSYSRLYTAGGIAVAMVLGNVLVSQKVGMSFTAVAVIGSLIAAATMLPICLRGKERNYSAQEQAQEFSFMQMFRYLFSNKYLLIYYLAFIISGALLTSGTIGLFVSYFLFGNELFNLILGAIAAVPGLILALCAPMIMRKVDKFKLLFWATAASAVLGLATYFVGYQNKALFITLTILRGLPAAMTGLLMFMFTPDCAEYGKFKTGVEARGITFSIQTFSAKLVSAIGTALSTFVLGLYGWQKMEAASFAEIQTLVEGGFSQTEQALHGLWVAHALIPAIGVALSLIPLLFYRLSDKDVQIMADCNAGEIERAEALEKLSPRLRKEFH